MRLRERNAARVRIVYWARRPAFRASILAALQAEPDIDLRAVATFEELAAVFVGVDGLVMNDVPIPRAQEFGALLRGSTTLRWLHITGAGREGLIAAGGAPPGVTVTGPAGAHAPALAEHAMAFILAFTRRIPEFALATRNHTWAADVRTRMTSVEGQTLAIIGPGNFGHQLAKRARAFGMNVIAATRSPKDDPDLDEVFPLTALRDVLARADFIAVTISRTPQTERLIGRAEFAACKPTAYFVNIARGGIVDQSALVEALRSGQIAGAGLDVTDPEPLPHDDPLWDAPNVIISPHCAGGTSPLSQRRLAGRVIENLARFRNGTLVPT
jgi:phosphoglycerate dehydrogenase-like enzyme